MRIHRQDLKWQDTGAAISNEKNVEVISRLCDYLDQKGIEWEFFGWQPVTMVSLKKNKPG